MTADETAERLAEIKARWANHTGIGERIVDWLLAEVERLTAERDRERESFLRWRESNHEYRLRTEAEADLADLRGKIPRIKAEVLRWAALDPRIPPGDPTRALLDHAQRIEDGEQS